MQERLTHANIEKFLAAMRDLLYFKAGLTDLGEKQDLRIAQVITNLGDCYFMEDEEFIRHIRSSD